MGIVKIVAYLVLLKRGEFRAMYNVYVWSNG